MISFSDLEKLLETDLVELQPEVRQLARILADVLNGLDQNLLDQGLPEEERRAIHRMVLTAAECHIRRLPPPSEEIAFWMTVLDPKVCVPEDSGLQ